MTGALVTDRTVDAMRRWLEATGGQPDDPREWACTDAVVDAIDRGYPDGVSGFVAREVQ